MERSITPVFFLASSPDLLANRPAAAYHRDWPIGWSGAEFWRVVATRKTFSTICLHSSHGLCTLAKQSEILGDGYMVAMLPRPLRPTRSLIRFFLR